MFPVPLSMLPDTLGVHVTKKAQDLGIELPKRSHRGDVGYDLMTIESVTVTPGEVGYFPTGTVWKLPTHDSELPWRIKLSIEPRTGLAARDGLFPMAQVVDPGFRPAGSNGLTLALRNLGSETLRFDVGDRVAQGVLTLVWVPALVTIDSDQIDETCRKDGKFGSTGR